MLKRRRGSRSRTAAGPTPVTDPECLPAAAGAYALVLALASPAAIVRPRLDALPQGLYVYAGSARGPGGIRARAARHFRADKPRHWHIDRLTGAADVRLSVVALPGARECDIVAALVRHAGATVPVPGFGSTDCGACAAHLLAVPSVEDALAALRRSTGPARPPVSLVHPGIPG